MNAVAAARQERCAFFAMLSDGEHPLELRCRHRDGKWSKTFAPTPERADELAHRLTTAGYDVYVGALPRHGHKLSEQLTYRPARALWVDCDSAHAVGALALYEPQPTAVVTSGGVDGDTAKRHAYWKLAEPIGAGQVKRHAKRLAHHLSGDLAATDAGRILRVPGSVNHKTGRVARLVSFTGEAFTLDELTGDLPDAPDWHDPDEPRQAKSDDELVALFQGTYRDTGDESRHEAFRSVCGVLLRHCDRLAPDVLLELAIAWAQAHTKPCRDRAELERNFDNLLARERQRRGTA